MDIFYSFPKEFYQFGDEKTFELFQNLSLYVDVLDQIKDNLAFYQDYYIQENERPDQVSQKIYRTPSYHWTFFLMNDKIRERGWPLSNKKLLLKVQEEHPRTVITTRNSLIDNLQVGRVIEGNQSGATATIFRRNLDLGQLILSDVNGTFIPEEIISSNVEENVPQPLQTATINSVSFEYESVHHYENAAGETVDIDPLVGPGALLTPVTYIDRYVKSNDELKQIRVIKPSSVVDVVRAFKEAVKS